MPIEPVSNSHRQINVVEPVGPAFEHVKKMLFHPFDLGKWFVIGFCAWLAELGESGGGGNFGNFGNHNFNSNNNHAVESFRQFYDKAHDWTLLNLYWIIPVAAFAFLFFLALWLLILWVSSHGKFMLLHCVALNKAEISEPWSNFAAEANSLFYFRAVIGLISLAVMLPSGIFIGVLIVQMILHGAADAAAICLCAGLAMFMLLFGILGALVHKFTMDFVVPIQFLRRGKCLAAWREFWQMLCANAGLFTLYILFQIAIAMAVGMIVVLAILLTCCIAGCFMMIPYIGTVLLLPVFVFKRAYSLYFFRQFGSDYDVFPPAPPMTPTPPAGLQPL